MSTLTELMRVYQQYHTKNATKLTHFIGVPVIYFAVMIPFCWLHLAGLPLSWILTLVLLAVYCFFDLRVAAGAAVLLLLLNGIAQICAGSQVNLSAMLVFLAAFIGGWILQLVGHYFEGNRPALLDNILQVFVAPAFVVAEWMEMLGLRG